MVIIAPEDFGSFAQRANDFAHGDGVHAMTDLYFLRIADRLENPLELGDDAPEEITQVYRWGWGGYGALGYGNTQNIGDDETPADAGPVPL